MKFSHRLRTVATATLLTVAASSAGLAMAGSSLADTGKAPRAVQCRINFQASSLVLRIGQDLVLSWTAVGADKLTASWTTGYVPFVGAVTTTMTNPGTYSYQVTGTSGGLYCGGAGVQVKFAADASAPSTSASRPAPSTESRTVRVTVTPTSSAGSSTAPADQGGNGDTGNAGSATASVGGGDNGGGNGGNGVANAGGGNGAAGNGADPTGTQSGSYPVQSPTSGSGVPWYQDPLHLLAVSALALIGSLLLWRREQLRAVFVRKH